MPGREPPEQEPPKREPPKHEPAHARPLGPAKPVAVLTGAIGVSLDSLGDVAESAWAGLKTVGDYWHGARGPRTVSVPAAEDPAAAWAL